MVFTLGLLRIVLLLFTRNSTEAKGHDLDDSLCWRKGQVSSEVEELCELIALIKKGLSHIDLVLYIDMSDHELR